MTLHSYHYVDHEDVGPTLEHPLLAQVRQAIDAMDGAARWMVCLANDEVCNLTVIGPVHGGYLVLVTDEDDDSYAPRNTAAGRKRIACHFGGEKHVFRMDQFVPRELVDLAVTSFLEKLKLSSDIEWYADSGRGELVERET